ncbi:MAG: 50S ribosomal protein L28 [Firmicutes bacterium]|nr:50S ribosomal protein L28 [Bacillota bacterium]MDI6823046.1 50S ribosomal protein L28 [Bacillota bacterium]MDI7248502.1 50S ribosomal protein L28 [Bacillota bacterium]
MGRKCVVCGKDAWVGFQISHSHRRTKKRWNPNLQKIRIVHEGRVRRALVCTRCLKAGKVQRAV